MINSHPDSTPTAPPPILHALADTVAAAGKDIVTTRPSSASSTSQIQTPTGNNPGHAASALHPRVAVILGVDRKWWVPLLVCRALSTAPAAWWGLRCAFTFLAELLHIRPGMGREGWAAAIVGTVGQTWDVERRFRVTEVALAIMWVCIYLKCPGKPSMLVKLTFAVLCICISFLLFRGLYDVSMVSHPPSV